MDWKLQDNHEKRRKNRTKEFYRNLLVGNLEKLAKNRQVCLICHINVKRNQETGNRQTNKQTKYCNPRAHARRALTTAEERDKSSFLEILSAITSVNDCTDA